MKISKIFHFLYFSILTIPLVSVPIFAIYSMNHEISGNSVIAYEDTEITMHQYAQCNQQFTANYASNNVSTYLFNFDTTHTYYINFIYRFETTIEDKYFLFGIWNNEQTQFRRLSVNPTTLENTYKAIITNSNFESGNLTDNNNSKVIVQCLGDTITASNKVYVRNVMLMDLTEMFGTEIPTLADMERFFPMDYYLPTNTEKYYISNVEVLLNDTDIMSQFLYSEYNFMDKYLGIYKFEPFKGIYTWAQNSFFEGTAPLVFAIAYQWFSYWLFISLAWLIFDVLMYVPMVIHRWLDKGALE